MKKWNLQTLRVLLMVAIGLLFALTIAFIFRTRVLTPAPQAANQPAPTTTRPAVSSTLSLLTDPFLQSPTASSVRVVWFTEFEGDQHQVAYGKDLQKTVAARTTKLTRSREDQDSKVGEQTEPGKVYRQPTLRDIWRHEAEIVGLAAGERVSYQVTSSVASGAEGEASQRRSVSSGVFSLAPSPPAEKPLKILLTSDHQMMPMTAANLQKVVETIGQVDAVFLAGDLTNIPDRASEWFDDNRGGAFFPCLQGRAHYSLEKNGVKTVYKGGQLIQNAPLFPAIGNHEVMGIFSDSLSLGAQFNAPRPVKAAEILYTAHAKQINPKRDVAFKADWLENGTFNTDTYREIFTLPKDSTGGEKYYAASLGNVRLVVLFATNIWRSPGLEPAVLGRYRERQSDLNNPDAWGYGQHIFEPIAKGSPQYNWLVKELNSPAFKQAKYRIVMFHHPVHSLGDNIVPPYTNPVQTINRNLSGTIAAIRYEYPRQQDYLIRDVLPLLEKAKVQLVFYGHSHLWNRFISQQGMHFLESSNVGNTYGAYLGDSKRQTPPRYREPYAAVGDPNGLEPVVPTIAPLTNEQGKPLPYIASNDITAFSILDTAAGTVASYYFDTRKPDSAVVKFDEFSLKPR